MNTNEWIKCWKAEENIAHIHGWDFSHTAGRYTEEEDLPWDYRETISRYLKRSMRILDIDTGGGEFLLSLNHPYENTAATEGYPPNVELCKHVLLPLGIDFRPGDGTRELPFENGSFDMVINRHGDFNSAEIHRILKSGGLFITQQVGGNNDRELVEMVLPGMQTPFPNHHMQAQRKLFEDAGFEILDAQESFRPINFYDVGAFVWFARIIEWEFPDFSVDKCFEQLLKMQQEIEKKGKVTGTSHRFLIVARK